jgi:hypothetical protein
LKNWLGGQEELPSFEEALLDWITYTCQPFTVTESKYFVRMLRASGCSHKIPKADAITNKLRARVARVEAETTRLLERTSATVTLSLDGWTSQNSLSMLAINAKWLGSNFEVYQACIEFIEIEGNHSGENLAAIVEKALKKHKILQKLLTITADNASNNDTLCRHLYTSLSRKYDDHLEEFPSREGTMRFKGEGSRIRCFAHVLNLIVEKILESLGSSNHKNAVEFLDRASEHIAKKRWNKITIPSASGVVARLRILVLWIHRSPQRIQEWDNRSNTTKLVNYDVDTRWNYTLRMIEDAFDCRAALNDTCDDHSELADLKLTAEHWN